MACLRHPRAITVSAAWRPELGLAGILAIVFSFSRLSFCRPISFTPKFFTPTFFIPTRSTEYRGHAWRSNRHERADGHEIPRPSEEGAQIGRASCRERV